MATRRKKMASDGSEASRAVGIVLEEMRGHFKAFGERFDGVDGRLDGIDRRLDGIDRRLDGVEGRLDRVEGRLDGVERRLEGVEGRLDGVEGRLEGVEGRLDDVSHEVGLVKIAVLENTRALKEKVDRAEVEAIVARVTGRGA
jgi:archaellum component FlaC